MSNRVDLNLNFNFIIYKTTEIVSLKDAKNNLCNKGMNDLCFFLIFRKGWIVQNSKLIYMPSPCLSRLSYSVDLVRPGYVEYVYRLPRNNRALIFHVDVKNEKCRSYRYAHFLFFFSKKKRKDFTLIRVSIRSALITIK